MPRFDSSSRSESREISDRPGTLEIGYDSPELSIVITCLNSAAALDDCLTAAEDCIAEHDLHAEIIVADNGSNDDSLEVARQHGARIVHVSEAGIGAAIRGGGAAARGEFLMLVDADSRYDLLQLPRFLIRLRAGSDFVQGCRLPNGGGVIEPGAMNRIEQHFVHPLLNAISRSVYGANVNDAHCEMRAMSRAFFDQLQLQASGPEIASEMIVKASLFNARVSQTPITFRSPTWPKASQSNMLADAWRRLRFMLLMCPQWALMFPGYAMMMMGMLGFFAGGMGIHSAGAGIESPLLWTSLVLTLLGFQSLQFGVYARTVAAHVGLLPADDSTTRVVDSTGLERGAMLGGASAVLGLAFIAWAAVRWIQGSAADPLSSLEVTRLLAPGLTLLGIGAQAVMGEFAASLVALVSAKAARRELTESLHLPAPVRVQSRRPRRSPWDGPNDQYRDQSADTISIHG